LIQETKPDVEWYKKYFEEKVELPQFDNAQFSAVIISQVAEGTVSRMLHSGMVFDEINSICTQKKGRTKEARLFKREPLKGLHYKHWTQPSMIPKNIVNHWGDSSSNKFSSAVKVGIESRYGKNIKYLEPEMAGIIAHTAVMGAYQDRSSKSKLTGEWIIYKIFNGKYYFLTLAGHLEGDEAIYDRIIKLCAPEFPFLF